MNLGHASPIFFPIFHRTILAHFPHYLGYLFLTVIVRAPQILHGNLGGWIGKSQVGLKGKKPADGKALFIPRVAYATAGYLPGYYPF